MCHQKLLAGREGFAVSDPYSMKGICNFIFFLEIHYSWLFRPDISHEHEPLV